MSAKGFFHPARGYWQTNSDVPDHIFADYPEGTVEVPVRPGANFEWGGESWQEVASLPVPVPQQLSLAQFLMGLVEQGWISPEEHGNWLSGNALPASVEAALQTIPETAPDGSMPRLRARSKAMRPSVIERDNPLLLMMAQIRGATDAQLDQMFTAYATV